MIKITVETVKDTPVEMTLDDKMSYGKQKKALETCGVIAEMLKGNKSAVEDIDTEKWLGIMIQNCVVSPAEYQKVDTLYDELTLKDVSQITDFIGNHYKVSDVIEVMAKGFGLRLVERNSSESLKKQESEKGS